MSLKYEFKNITSLRVENKINTSITIKFTSISTYKRYYISSLLPLIRRKDITRFIKKAKLTPRKRIVSISIIF